MSCRSWHCSVQGGGLTMAGSRDWSLSVAARTAWGVTGDETSHTVTTKNYARITSHGVAPIIIITLIRMNAA